MPASLDRVERVLELPEVVDIVAGEDHDHAVCRGCGMIFDVERSCYPLPQAPECLPSGLDVVGVRVEYEVVCEACRGGGDSTERTGNDESERN